MAEERSMPPKSKNAFLEPLTRDKQRLFQWFFFGVFAFLIYQLLSAFKAILPHDNCGF